MLFALNFPVAEKWLNKVEALPPSRQFRAKAPVAAVLIAGTAIWVHFVGVKDKYTFNARSPYWQFVVMARQLLLFVATVLPSPSSLDDACSASEGDAAGTNYTTGAMNASMSGEHARDALWHPKYA